MQKASTLWPMLLYIFILLLRISQGFLAYPHHTRGGVQRSKRKAVMEPQKQVV